MDASYIIDNRLSGKRTKNENIEHRQQRPRENNGIGKIMPEYEEISRDLFDDVMDIYRNDMVMFGYSGLRDTVNGTVYTKCSYSQNGCC